MSVKILQGQVMDRLLEIPDDTFDCIITSPPYWGLRDYGVDGQIGLERTLGEHLEVMTNIFRECRRVLKPTGTLWLNYGDCYATSPNGRSAAATKAAGGDDRTFRDKPFSTIGPIYGSGVGGLPPGGRRGGDNNPSGGHLKPKDLCMIPNRLAIALQEDGWWVRSEIIWAKPNPMPESVNDRPATSHEKIWLMTKSKRSFWDKDEAKMPVAAASLDRWDQDLENQAGSARANGGAKTNGNMKAVGGPSIDPRREEGRPRHNERWKKSENAKGFRGGSYVNGKPGPRQETGNQEGDYFRNLRNYERAPVQVWEIATMPCSFAHFATFPPELVARCLRAGCPKGGHVLDPFGGSGTTGLVADEYGMDATLIELNPEYIEIATARLRAGLVKVEGGIQRDENHGPLFQIPGT